MAELKQIQDSSAIFIGWYGTCKNQNCADFPLTSTAIRAKIQKVFQTSVAPKNNGYLSFDGTIDSSYDNDLQSFTKLECGKSYIIVLKPGVSSLVIDEFSFTDGGNSVGGLVTSDCKPEPTPTPIKPTPTPIKPTPTPEPVSADCNCGDENTTNVTIAGAMVPSNSHQFAGFPLGSVVSYNSATLETKGIACTIELKFPNGVDAGLIVLNGKEPNNTTFSLKYGNICYSATTSSSNKTSEGWELELSVSKTLSNECGDDKELPTPKPIDDPTPTPIQPTPTPQIEKLVAPVITGLEDSQMNSLSINVTNIDTKADTVKIEIALDSQFSNIVRIDQESASTLRSSQLDIIPNLSSGTTYYIRLIAIGSGYEDSDYSATFTAMTLEEPTPTPIPPTPTPEPPTPTPEPPTPTPEPPTPTPEPPTPTPEQPEDCCEGMIKIPTTGGVTGPAGVTISGLEAGGTFCMSELTSTDEKLSTTVLDPTGGSAWGGNITLSFKPVSTGFIYTSPSDNKCYKGDFTKGFQNLEEV